MYLNVLVGELKEAGVLAPETEAGTVDDLLRAFEGGTGTTARLIDIPPLELEAARSTLAELRSHAEALPSAEELAAVYEALRRTAERERRPLLEVSAGIGFAFLTSAKSVGRTTSSSHTPRTGGRCATRASRPTRGASPARTAGPCTRISTLSARRTPSARSAGWARDA